MTDRIPVQHLEFVGEYSFAQLAILGGVSLLFQVLGVHWLGQICYLGMLWGRWIPLTRVQSNSFTKFIAGNFVTHFWKESIFLGWCLRLHLLRGRSQWRHLWSGLRYCSRHYRSSLLNHVWLASRGSSIHSLLSTTPIIESIECVVKAGVPVCHFLLFILINYINY